MHDIDCLVDVVGESPSQVREVCGQIPCRVIPNTLNIALQLTGWYQEKWIISKHNLSMKRRDITVQMLKKRKTPNNQSININQLLTVLTTNVPSQGQDHNKMSMVI